MSKLEIDSDNGEIRVDGYEYCSTKVSVKTYGVSSESSQTLNSADIRLTRNDGYIDNLTVTGGSNVTITRNNADKFTIDSYNSDTTYSIESSSSNSPLGAKITLKDNNNVMDNVFIVQGTGVGVVYSVGDNITISNSGVTSLASGTGISVSGATGSVTVGNTGVVSLNGSSGPQFVYNTFTDGTTPTTGSSGHTTLTLSGSNGIRATTSPDTATISMSEVTNPRANDLTIAPSATQSVLATNVIPVDTTIELHGVILFAFNPGGATNTFDVVLSTSSGTIGGNTSRAVVGFTCHAGGVSGSLGESTKANPTFTYPTTIANTNEHAIRFSGIFQTDLNTPNSLVIRMKNNNAQGNENLVIYAKSFIRYNII